MLANSIKIPVGIQRTTYFNPHIQSLMNLPRVTERTQQVSVVDGKTIADKIESAIHCDAGQNNLFEARGETVLLLEPPSYINPCSPLRPMRLGIYLNEEMLDSMRVVDNAVQIDCKIWQDQNFRYDSCTLEIVHEPRALANFPLYVYLTIRSGSIFSNEDCMALWQSYLFMANGMLYSDSYQPGALDYLQKLEQNVQSRIRSSVRAIKRTIRISKWNFI